MTNKEKDILAMFSELNSMLYEVLGDCNKALSENIELKKEIDWFKKYTDALIEHKDMVCLPADLKNLRESNATLATENEELKKKVETLNGIITQAWFTDVEEKNKQIDYLLNKVRELNDPELKDDEQLTKTFMDAQTNAKDIEFDAEKLVKSVKDYADSLNNESNLKYFCASNGKWYNAELMKQDTEPELMPLKQHNDSKLTNVFGVNSKNSGFACPICTSELIYTNPDMMLTSHPPKREVRCSNCKHIDYVY
jgi:uncharacterized coiled-coil protein SlyX